MTMTYQITFAWFSQEIAQPSICLKPKRSLQAGINKQLVHILLNVRPDWSWELWLTWRLSCLPKRTMIRWNTELPDNGRRIQRTDIITSFLITQLECWQNTFNSLTSSSIQWQPQ